jgi:hypothetical protein
MTETLNSNEPMAHYLMTINMISDNPTPGASTFWTTMIEKKKITNSEWDARAKGKELYCPAFKNMFVTIAVGDDSAFRERLNPCASELFNLYIFGNCDVLLSLREMTEEQAEKLIANFKKVLLKKGALPRHFGF